MTDLSTTEEDQEKDKPILLIPRRIDDQLLSYARAVELEVSGLGCVKEEGGIFRITEVFLPSQEGSSVSTDIDKGAVAKWIAKRKTGKGINLWWHSHNDMDVFESLTDEETAGETLKLFSGEWMVSLVINNKGRRLAVLYLRSPVPLSVALEIHIDAPLNPETEKWYKEAKKKVRKEKIVVQTFGKDGKGRLPGRKIEPYPKGVCEQCGTPVAIGTDICRLCSSGYY